MTRTSTDIGRWIDQCLAHETPRSKSLIITIFGDAIAPRGGAVWLGGLIRLLEPFGINDRLARTSMFRLSEEGWFESKRQGRRSLYALTTPGMARFARAYRRIYRAPAGQWDKSWTLVLFPRTATGAGERAELRKELRWEGFGLVAPGLFARPGVDAAVLGDILCGLKLDGTVFAMCATELEAVAARPARELVGECWDLADLLDEYSTFIDRFMPVAGLLRRGEPFDAQQAFQIRTLLIHEFRRVVLHDPQFPAELLPDDWPGFDAYDLCREIYARVLASAEDHLSRALEGAHGPLPRPAPALFERFGGIDPTGPGATAAPDAQHATSLVA